MLQLPRRCLVFLKGRGSLLGVARATVTVLSFTSLGLFGCGTSAPSQNTDSTPVATATVSPTPDPFADGCRKEQFAVANTNGLGVNLRKTPGGDVVTAYVEGTKLSVCAEKLVDGQQWYRVTGEDGAEGWVMGTYVVPTSPMPTSGQ